ncbi:MAG TPA: RsmD family RNA methyltransferase [Patescibacteria group bacterium]|nr:RsmD family RNA methyltransferase [Patescibacteria group bacterium]
MRIVAGSLGGRNFDSPKGHRTHPMSEKARGGLFATLGDIAELTVLDAFAGSGAISFEAISRGAKHVISIDIDSSAVNIIKNNVKELRVTDKVKAIKANASGWSDNNPDKRFDIIVCDPPFDQIKITLLQKLSQHLNDEGVFVVNIPGSLEPFDLKALKIVKNKKYGDAQLVFYKKIR